MLEFIRTFRPLLDRRTKWRVVLAALGALVVAAIEASGLLLLVPLVQTLTDANGGAIPRSTAWIADRMTKPTPLGVAAVLGGLVFVLFVIKGVTSVLYLRWNVGFILETETETSRRLLHAYLHAPYAFHLTHNSAELQRTIHDDVRRLYEEAVLSFVGGAADAVLIVGVTLVLVIYDPIVALCAGGYFTLVGVGYQRLIHGRAQDASAQIQGQIADAYRIVQQSVSAVKAVQIRHRQDFFVDQLAGIKRRTARGLRTLLVLQQVPRYYLEIALIAGIGIMAAAVYPLRSTAAATATLTLFLAAGFRLLPSLNRVLVGLGSVRAGLPQLQRVAADLMELEAAIESEGVPHGDRLSHVQIVFAGVTFAYSPTDPPVLDDVSFSITPGESVGFVGPSGAGKSTLLDILLGLLSPQSGTITLDGVPLEEVRSQWQRSIGYVPQDVVVLDESIRANVALGEAADDIDDGRVDRALTMAQLDSTIVALPQGLETRLGERGVRLSGGQRQRIGIARALYDDPAVLVLDEATSALDTETEARITETTEALRGQLTQIIVTHRLSTVRYCDRLYFLENGRIGAAGTFSELVERSPAFAELVRLAELQAAADDGPTPSLLSPSGVEAVSPLLSHRTEQ